MFLHPAKMNAKRSSSIKSFLILFCISLKLHVSTAADSISPGQSLSGSQTIVSQGGLFELGFFTPGNSHNYYIGIWYKRIPKQTVVWVANRETPLPSTSSELKIAGDGNLVLVNSSKTIWSTNATSVVSNSTIAVLLDTGNLVLRGGLNSSALMWQSFEHATDTWLSEQKIGFNNITGEIWRLTSWRSLEDPSPGPFSLDLDRDATPQLLLLWNSSQQYWSSGVWNGEYFSLIPESTQLTSPRLRNRYNFSYVTNENESYFTTNCRDKIFIVRFVLDVSGKILAYILVDQEWILYWSRPNDECDVYSFCGAFGICNSRALPFCKCLWGFEPRSLKDWSLNDRSGGCVRKTQLHCVSDTSVHGEEDGFLRMPDVKFPDNPISLSVANANECELGCLNNCSCTAYAFSFDSRCLIWIGDLLNLEQLVDGGGSGVGDLYLRRAASELISSSGGNRSIVGASVGSVLGIIAVLVIVFFLLRRGKRRQMSRASKKVHGHLIQFSYNDLKTATARFSERLGHGGFGSVYKGTLPDSTAIAVKKLEGLRQGEKQFRMEVSTLGMIQHVNLIRLRGFCSEGSKKLLVYDFMPNGSLDTALFHENSVILEWKTRYKIAVGIARGLSYLHERCRDCIIHCDIKPENILLDAMFCSMVADFGMAKLLGRDFSKVLTTLRGTIGYLAPEWISGVPITAKADVYSYGMVLLEIISGRRNTKNHDDGNVGYFPLWAAGKTAEGDVLSILDPRLEGIADMEELTRACKVACWCIQSAESFRPSMGTVVEVLEGVLEVAVPPVPSHLQNLAATGESMVFFSEYSAHQGADVQQTVA